MDGADHRCIPLAGPSPIRGRLALWWLADCDALTVAVGAAQTASRPSLGATPPFACVRSPILALSSNRSSSASQSSASILSFAWLIVSNFASCGVGGIASGFSRGVHDYLLHLVFAIHCISILLSRVSLTALRRYDAEGSPSEDHR